MEFEIAVCAMFRDSQVWHGHNINQVDAFFERMNEQEKDAGVRLRYYLLEGDSKDNTREVLDKYATWLGSDRVNIIHHSVGGSPPASVATAERFAALSEVGNACLRPARDAGHTHIYWMESDLIPQPGLLSKLLDSQLALDTNDKVMAISPVAVIEPQGHRLFYDTWAFEGISGEKWSNFDLEALKRYPSRYRPMRAIGSAALLNGKALLQNKIDFGTGCFPALCASGRAMGYNIYCDLNLEVKHPCNALIASRWV
jgi:hypothetical protein